MSKKRQNLNILAKHVHFYFAQSTEKRHCSQIITKVVGAMV